MQSSVFQASQYFRLHDLTTADFLDHLHPRLLANFTALHARYGSEPFAASYLRYAAPQIFIL